MDQLGETKSEKNYDILDDPDIEWVDYHELRKNVPLQDTSNFNTNGWYRLSLYRTDPKVYRLLHLGDELLALRSNRNTIVRVIFIGQFTNQIDLEANKPYQLIIPTRFLVFYNFQFQVKDQDSMLEGYFHSYNKEEHLLQLSHIILPFLHVAYDDNYMPYLITHKQIEKCLGGNGKYIKGC